MSSLMLLFLMPFMAAIIILIFSRASREFVNGLAFCLSLFPLIFLIYNHSHLVEMEMRYPWISALSIEFFLSIDALSLIFLYLTAFIIPISILASNAHHPSSPHVFFFFVFLLQGLLIGFFTAKDLALFTIFWEAILLPLYFIINYWGEEKRHEAALKFLVYMIAGSSLMVAAVLFLFFTADAAGNGTFNLESLQNLASKAPHAKWIFAIFLLAFAVKTPLFPFHAWLPDAYCGAPITGTILLSAILSKAGIYGIIRIGMELYPQLLKEWSAFLLPLAIIGVFYGGLAAWRQNDFKRLIAYSSLSHINFILVGLFAWQQQAQAGAILQVVNHSITITALFLLVGWLQVSLKTTSMNNQGGLAKYLPHLCWITLIVVLASVALPGTNNFIGELMIFFGLFGKNPWLTAILGFSIILSVIYMLRFMQKMYFGKPIEQPVIKLDIGPKEFFIISPLIILIFGIGLYPSPILNEIKPAIEKIVTLAQGAYF